MPIKKALVRTDWNERKNTVKRRKTEGEKIATHITSVVLKKMWSIENQVRRKAQIRMQESINR